MFLAAREETNMSLELSRSARRNAFLVVKACSKGVLTPTGKHGKSPCFLRCVVFALVCVDYTSVDFAVVDVREILE